MKKLLAVALLLAVCAGCAFAEGDAPHRYREGDFAYAGMSAEEYAKFIADSISSDNYSWVNYEISIPEYAPYYQRW